MAEASEPSLVREAIHKTYSSKPLEIKPQKPLYVEYGLNAIQPDLSQELRSNNLEKKIIKIEQASQELINSAEQSANKDSKQNREKNPNFTSNLVSNVSNWLKYPSGFDTKWVEQNILTPAFVGTFVGASAYFTAISPAFFSNNPNIMVPTLLTSIGLSTISSAGLIAGVGINSHIKEREKKNRMPFSNLFTVSKSFMTPKSYMTNAIKTVDSSFKQGFVGELHFIGINKESWNGLDTPLAIMRDGAKGLYNLAVACEEDDPRLANIQWFIGLSPLLKPQFEKYGFHIFKGRDVVKQSFPRKVASFLLNIEGSHIGIINRENLIKNKHVFARLSKNTSQAEK